MISDELKNHFCAKIYKHSVVLVFYKKTTFILIVLYFLIFCPHLNESLILSFKTYYLSFTINPILQKKSLNNNPIFLMFKYKMYIVI